MLKRHRYSPWEDLLNLKSFRTHSGVGDTNAADKFGFLFATLLVILAVMAILLAASLGVYYGIHDSLSANAARRPPTFGRGLRADAIAAPSIAVVQPGAGRADVARPQSAAGDHKNATLNSAGLPATADASKRAQSASEKGSPTAVPLLKATLLKDVPLGKQERNLSCEFQSASDLAWYYGKPYGWEEIFMRVGHDPGGNPHKGFVGDSLDDPPGRLYPNGYGVYAEPIAAALSGLGLPAKVYYHKPTAWLKEQIATKCPVMVWAITGMRSASIETWTTSDGTLIRGARGEHTYLVVGYNKEGVWVNNPWTGEQEFYRWSVFLQSWDTFDRMSVVIENK